MQRATPRLRALLAGARAGPLDADPVVVEVRSDVRPLVEAQRESVERLIAEAAGRRVRVDIREAESGAEAVTASPPQPGASVTEHPLVKAAVEAFGGSVGRVLPKRTRTTKEP